MFFLCFSPVFQVLLVALFLGIRGKYPIWHASLCLAIWILRLVYYSAKTVYGYKRFRLLHIFMTAAGTWSTIIYLFWVIIAQEKLVFTVISWVGMALLLLSGEIYLVIRVPGLLYRREGINTVPLFKFAFKPATVPIVRSLQIELQRSGSRCIMRSKSLRCDSDFGLNQVIQT